MFSNLNLGLALQDVGSEEKLVTPAPPANFNDFLKQENITDWPQKLTSEGLLNLEDEDLPFKSKENVSESLRAYASFPVKFLDDIEDRIGRLESTLNRYSSVAVAEASRESLIDKNLFNIPRYVLDRAEKLELLQVETAKKEDVNEAIKAQLLKSVEHMKYPGFHPTEILDLPGHLEAPKLLNMVAKAQNFKTGFMKYFKKIFLSEAAVALCQDTFWWIFLKKFETNNVADQEKLFDRLADSMVALFLSIHPDVKDKFFSVFADCLAQAVYAAYFESFPESKSRFGEQFKNYVLDLCSEWVTGIKAPPNSWKNWDLDKLLPNQKQDQTADMIVVTKPVGVVKQLSAVSFGDEGHTLTDVHKTHQQQQQHQSQLVIQPRKTESHELGPGADHTRVRFKLYGRTPLVAHWLRLHQLSGAEPCGGQSMTRTQVNPSQVAAPTYREVINRTLKSARQTERQFAKISEKAKSDLVKLERQRYKQIRDIERLKEQVLSNKDQIKMISERILDQREQSNLIGRTTGYDLTNTNQQYGDRLSSSEDELGS